MTPNAFTLPASGIHFKQQSPKQLRDSATRVNRNTHVPNPSQAERDKSLAIAGAGSFISKDR